MAAGQRRRVEVRVNCLGLPVGSLVWAKEGRREYSAFAYAPDWLGHGDAFNVSADLAWALGFQTRRAASPRD